MTLSNFLMVAGVVLPYAVILIVVLCVFGFLSEYKPKEKKKEEKPKAYRDVCVMCGGYVTEGTHVCGICKIKYGGDLEDE
jgi:hypothetical protein